MRQKIELVITVLLLAGLIFASRKVSRYAASDNVKDVAGNKVVVDAGHGGSDPGKIGINGLEEKEVNLAIAQYVEELLKKEKIEVVMTREKDEMLSEDSGEKTKIGDMKMPYQVLQMAEQRYAWAIGRASSQLHQMTLDEAENFTDIVNRLIPDLKQHDKYFASLGSKEYLRTQ